MKLNPYLAFNGQCREAFEFYEKALGGKITFIQTAAPAFLLPSRYACPAF